MAFRNPGSALDRLRSMPVWSFVPNRGKPFVANNMQPQLTRSHLSRIILYMAPSGSTRGSSVGGGAYDLLRASYLLGISERTLLRWSTPTLSGKPALVAPSLSWAFSFHDLLSLAVIAVLRQERVTPEHIRRGIAYLEDRFSTSRPFARREVVEALQTADKHVYLIPEGVDVTRGGQMVLLETVREYLQPVEYGSNRLARLWRPVERVSLNPEIQTGLPCISGTRVTTDIVAARVSGGEPREQVAEDLGVSVTDITAATGFERRLQSGNGLARIASDLR